MSYGFMPDSVYGISSPALQTSVAIRHAVAFVWHALIAATHGPVASFMRPCVILLTAGLWWLVETAMSA